MGDFKRMTDFDLSRARFLTISALASLTLLFTVPAALGAPVKHDQGTGAIAKSVTVPPGYDTIYFSGLGGAGGVAPGESPGDTEAQATRALEAIKKNLADEGMTFGNVVMMHAYLGPDPKTGAADRAGWGRAYGKYFGTADEPNKPARSSIQVSFAGGNNLIEIEVIAVRPHKD